MREFEGNNRKIFWNACCPCVPIDIPKILVIFREIMSILYSIIQREYSRLHHLPLFAFITHRFHSRGSFLLSHAYYLDSLVSSRLGLGGFANLSFFSWDRAHSRRVIRQLRKWDVTGYSSAWSAIHPRRDAFQRRRDERRAALIRSFIPPRYSRTFSLVFARPPPHSPRGAIQSYPIFRFFFLFTSYSFFPCSYQCLYLLATPR